VLLLLLGGLFLLLKARQAPQQELSSAQQAPFFPGLTADQVYRIDIASLSDTSLLLRKEAGMWEVATGRDVMAQLMSQSREEPAGEENTQATEEQPSGTDTVEGDTPENETGTEDTGGNEAAPENQDSPAKLEDPGKQGEAGKEGETTAEQPVLREVEPPQTQQPEDPRNDPGPAGDPFRRFYKAKTDPVTAMIDAMIGLRHGDLVTSDKEQQAQLGVLNDIVGMEVTFYDQNMNKLAAIIIGANDTSYSSCYVRLPGVPDEDNIYQVPVSLKRTFTQTLEMLRDPAIFSAAPETVMSYTVTDHEKGTGLRLQRTEGVWQGTDSEGSQLSLDPAKVDDLLDQLSRLSANSFVNPEEQRRMPPPDDETWNEADPYGILAPTVEIEFTTADNVTGKLVVGRLEGTTYYAATSDDLNDVFKVSMNVIDNLRPLPSTLAPEAATEGESTETGTTDTGTTVPGNGGVQVPGETPSQPPGG
jgi:hypothetical protein